MLQQELSLFDPSTLTNVDTLKASLSAAYNSPPPLSPALIIVQSAALMEIAHSAVGLVRSPVIVTAMQVMSRIIALFAVVYSPAAQAHFGSGLMILGWSLVEVPRYAFYVAALISGDATKGTPYPLFYLRYSLFYVLYPLGISGEVRNGEERRVKRAEERSDEDESLERPAHKALAPRMGRCSDELIPSWLLAFIALVLRIKSIPN